MAGSNIQGALRVFRLFGISVHLHWMWFVALAILIEWQVRQTNQPVWVVFLQFIALFTIVLMHEFGHALACRSVGGKADTIVLWPLGGIAFVKPPLRPWPVMWSLAAGPLVNLVLATPLYYLVTVSYQQIPDQWFIILQVVFWINLGLLCFNLLPIYPLDGGQILQALLWLFIGRPLSLKITALIGLAAAAVALIAAIIYREPWIMLMAAFVGWQAWIGYRAAIELAAHERKKAAQVAAAETQTTTIAEMTTTTQPGDV